MPSLQQYLDLETEDQACTNKETEQSLKFVMRRYILGPIYTVQQVYKAIGSCKSNLAYNSLTTP